MAAHSIAADVRESVHTEATFSLLESLANMECFQRVLEIVGPVSAAVLSSACPRFESPHTEAFWRSELGYTGTSEDDFDLDETEESLAIRQDRDLPAPSQSGAVVARMSCRTRFARTHGPTLAKYGRKERLRRALEERGLELRSDSRLCSHFINTGTFIHAGGITGIVDTMEQMNFMHGQTTYREAFERIGFEIMRQAHKDATEAFFAGEEDRIDVRKYVEKVNHDQMSELAKTCALRDYAYAAVMGEDNFQHFQAGDVSSCQQRSDQSMDALLSNLLSSAPCSLRHRLHTLFTEAIQLCSNASGSTVEDYGLACIVALRHPNEDAIVRRARLRSETGAARAHLESSLVRHVDAVRQLARSHTDSRVLEFPPSLSREERAFLHELAEELQLHHESVSRAEGRILQIQRSQHEANFVRGTAFVDMH